VLELHGDLWELAQGDGVDAVCVLTNGFRTDKGECVMGKGVAGEAKRRWPDLPARVGRLLGEHGNRCFRLRVEGLRPDLVTFPTKPERGPEGQPGFAVDSDPTLIVASARQLFEMATKFGWQRVLLPRPGVGAGKLRWEDVKPLLEPLLDDRFSAVTF
jgi:hypothetical protein